MALPLSVVLSVVRDEGAKWRKLSDGIEVVQRNAAALHLSVSAFYIGDASAELHHQAYTRFHEFIVRVLGQAITEFDELAAALYETADIYDAADREIAFDLNKVYRPTA